MARRDEPLIDERPCPCGTGEPYALCCGPLHHGARAAATALELMRSRYAAYAKNELAYLVDTAHPERRDDGLFARLAESNAGVRWTGLKIVATARGRAVDDEGVVEFEAHYEAAGKPGVIQERSRFGRSQGDWVYLDGGAAPAAGSPGRNDPCPCGSGKKAKKCCLGRQRP